MNRVLKVTILLGCSVATTPLAYAGGQTGVNSQGDGGVQEAIRFERAKDAADARQARIQAGPASDNAAVGSADRRMTGPSRRTTKRSVKGTERLANLINAA
jgi:hypothetical protein